MLPSLIGCTLGKYEIVELLGRGGMATVYKGYQREIDRYVAVKVLPPHPGQDPQFVERFRLEARTIARLQHPHILPVYDYGVERDILYQCGLCSASQSRSGSHRLGAYRHPYADVWNLELQHSQCHRRYRHTATRELEAARYG